MRTAASLLAVLALAAYSAAQENLDIDGLRSKVPDEWKKEEPTNRMRFAQFKLPKQKGDSEDAELVIFKGLGGSAKANIDRWIEQFDPPQGKKIEDAAKVSEVKVSGRTAHYLDVEGTYKFRFPPFDPNARIMRKDNYRMIAVHLEGEKDVYHIKLTGPAATVGHYKKGFDDWLKGLK